MSRYKRRNIATNNEELYRKVLKKKGMRRGIMQYTTPSMRRPTQEQLDTIRYENYVWSVGDRFWKVADKYYNNKDLWYIIARFNNKPTEAHIDVGETIKIPIDLGRAREVLG